MLLKNNRKVTYRYLYLEQKLNGKGFMKLRRKEMEETYTNLVSELADSVQLIVCSFIFLLCL